MKIRTILLTMTAVFGFMVVRAADTNPQTCKTTGPQACENTGPEANPGKKIYAINGSVVQNNSKRPMEKVSVTAYYTSKKEKVVITDCNGNYAFDDLKPGVYKFVFEKEGFKKVTRDNVTIKIDEAFLLDIEMIANEETRLFPTPFLLMDH